MSGKWRETRHSQRQYVDRRQLAARFFERPAGCHRRPVLRHRYDTAARPALRRFCSTLFPPTPGVAAPPEMKSNRPVQRSFRPLSIFTTVSQLPPTQLFVSALVVASLLTLLYLAAIHLVLPPPTPSPTTSEPTASSSSPTVVAGCEVGGCSGQLCRRVDTSGAAMFSTCMWLDEYRCYREPFAVCGPSADSRIDECEWQQNEAMRECLTTARSGSSDRTYGGVQ